MNAIPIKIYDKTNWLLKQTTDNMYDLMRTRKKRDVFTKVASLSVETRAEGKKPLRKYYTIHVPYHQNVFRQIHEKDDAREYEKENLFHLLWSDEGCGYLTKGVRIARSDLMWTKDHDRENRWFLAHHVPRELCVDIDHGSDLIAEMLKSMYGIQEYRKGFEQGYFK